MENVLIVQHHCAYTFYALAVRQLLDQQFPGHWIGRRGPIERPLRSPKITRFDFLLRCHLKKQVYATPSEALNVLRHRIIQESQLITSRVFSNVRKAFQDRFYHCLEVSGSYSELK